MKTNELKKVLKPLIKQCIKEVIFEEGVLSGIISEVVKGVDAAPVLREQKVVSKPTNGHAKKKLQEQRKKMMDAIGKSSYNGVNVFEDVEPTMESNSRSPLASVSPDDPGVDISTIFNSNWSKLI